MGLNIELAKERIEDVMYSFCETTTVCFIITECGAIFVGEAHCFDRNDYKIEMGKDEAYKNAFSKFLDAEAYHQKFLQKRMKDFTNRTKCKFPDPISGGVKEYK